MMRRSSGTKGCVATSLGIEFQQILRTCACSDGSPVDNVNAGIRQGGGVHTPAIVHCCSEATAEHSARAKL